MIDFLKEFWEFLNERKKYWLIPIIIVLALKNSRLPKITDYIKIKY